MISCTHYEYLCVECGWFPSRRYTQETEERVIKDIDRMVLKHKEMHRVLAHQGEHDE